MSCNALYNVCVFYRFPFQDGFNLLHPVNTLVCREHNLYFLWDRFKHVGDSQYLEIVTTSKEIMSFHDRGAVVFRFRLSRNKSPNDAGSHYLLVKGRL